MLLDRLGSRIGYHRVFLAPDDGGGAGGAGDGTGGDGDGDGGDNKQYTKEEVEAMMTRWRKGLQKENAEKEKTIAQLKEEMEALKSSVAKATGAEGDDKTFEGRVEILERKYTRDIEALNKSLSEEKERREAAEKKAHSTRMQNELQRALEKANCIDVVGGERYFKEIVQFDEHDNVFLIELANGKPVPLEEGIKELLPDYMKRPLLPGGGAGTSGSGTRRTRDQKLVALDQAKKELEELKKRTDSSKPHEIERWYKMDREVKAMEQELATSSK